MRRTKPFFFPANFMGNSKDCLQPNQLMHGTE
jgi:hypothetical protein